MCNNLQITKLRILDEMYYYVCRIHISICKIVVGKMFHSDLFYSGPTLVLIDTTKRLKFYISF